MENVSTLSVIKALIVLVIGYIALRSAIAFLLKQLRDKVSDQWKMVIRNVLFYLGFSVIIFYAVRVAGLSLTPLLGAAGIAGVALGFASQTSVSNLISGVFLVAEKPFKVGDVIEAGGTAGVVMSVDLLSVKLRCFDNRYVRVPNEQLIKSQVTNFTHFPIRRHDVMIGVAYKEDVSKVKAALAKVAENNIYSLDEPEPLILFKNFGNSALEFQLGVWCVKEDFLQLRNSIMEDIKRCFDEDGIEIPFPHTSLYTGEATKPFPIRLVTESETQP